MRAVLHHSQCKSLSSYCHAYGSGLVSKLRIRPVLTPLGEDSNRDARFYTKKTMEFLEKENNQAKSNSTFQ